MVGSRRAGISLFMQFGEGLDHWGERRDQKGVPTACDIHDPRDAWVYRMSDRLRDVILWAGHQDFQQEDPHQAGFERDQVSAARRDPVEPET